jgi:hypothetical protein
VWVNAGSHIYADIAGVMTGGVDQSVVTTLGCNSSSPSLFQSFTAGATGKLTAVSMTLNSVRSNVALSIRVGVGHGGTALYSATVNTVNGVNTFTIPGVALVAGSHYSIALVGPAAWAFQCGTDDLYAGGTAGTTVAAAGLDISFATYLTAGNAVVVTPSGRVGIATETPTASLDVAAGTIRLRESVTPLSTSACQPGELRWDANFVYVCVASNTWRRATLAPY